ncbi:MAG: hypothetical protein MJZ16_11895 [Bacteroidales bacterium]|nr:hypothetical protein [Bacteroidales bacterium]
MSATLDAESYSSEQQRIYGKSVKGNGGTIGVIILSLILLVCCAEAVFSIGKYYSGEYAFDALIKRILLSIVGALITLSAVLPLI